MRGVRPHDRPILVRALLGLAAAVALIVAVVAGVGWLYLLRDTRWLDAGPALRDALPLQRLAGHGDQPLLRLVVAWLPTGVAAGVALAALTRLRWWARGAVAGVTAFVLLLLAGGVADAVTESDPLTSHLGVQPHRGALWLASALVLAGALIPWPRRAGRRGATRASTRLVPRSRAGP